LNKPLLQLQLIDVAGCCVNFVLFICGCVLRFMDCWYTL